MKTFVNLTNGIEALPDLSRVDGYIRIQSTHLEQGLYDVMINDIDYSFLVCLAVEREATVVDFSQHKKCSRALYLGVPFITYILNKVWFGQDVCPRSLLPVFEPIYYKMKSKKLLKKFVYMKKLLNFTDERQVNIETVCNTTKNDGNYAFYNQILNKHYVKD